MMLIIAAVVFFYTILLAATIATGAWVCSPLQEAARHRRRPPRVVLMDLFGLVFLAQLPMAVVHGVGFEPPLMVALDGLGLIAMTAVWWFGCRTISKAGIEQRWMRAALVCIVLPAGYFAPVVVLVLIPLASVSEADPRQIAIMEVVFIDWMIIAGWLSRRAVEKSRSEADRRQSLPST